MDARRYSIAFGVSLSITSVLSALLVVVKESNEPLLNWMKQATGHHWITHGVLTLVTFVVLGLVLAQLGPARAGRPSSVALANGIAAGVIAGGAIIAGFFLLH